MVVAETTLSKRNWDRALDEGFRRLAAYIFGRNSAREHVEMTAPVAVTGHPPGKEKIPMTVPVSAVFHPAEEHTISFVMPEGREVDSLPIPRDDRIHLRAIRPRRIACLRFRGTYRGAPVKDKIADLMDRLGDYGLRPIGEPSFAGYDPPSTLPFLRRNEVWIEVMFA
ncbi:MAG TPA: heme-binding protein [Polyangiaceae bacterium]